MSPNEMFFDDGWAKYHDQESSWSGINCCSQDIFQLSTVFYVDE